MSIPLFQDNKLTPKAPGERPVEDANFGTMSSRSDMNPKQMTSASPAYQTQWKAQLPDTQSGSLQNGSGPDQADLEKPNLVDLHKKQNTKASGRKKPNLDLSLAVAAPGSCTLSTEVEPRPGLARKYTNCVAIPIHSKIQGALTYEMDVGRGLTLTAEKHSLDRVQQPQAEITVRERLRERPFADSFEHQERGRTHSRFQHSKHAASPMSTLKSMTT